MKSDIEYEVIIENNCRSPSWGAWIEILLRRILILNIMVAPPRGERGLKLCHIFPISTNIFVAPPRGERGLKFEPLGNMNCNGEGRSPSWGAWIEIKLRGIAKQFLNVAPPRGERGLKSIAHTLLMQYNSRSPSWGAWIEMQCLQEGLCNIDCRSPSWGAWIEINPTTSANL